ncbi:MAG: hypothetical protein M3Y53_12685 [Thermoproteota archaeon]|nr:hypothetical protein [Thermoproteota archaeon]
MIKEKLMCHSIGLDQAYFKPTENEVLQEYLKAVDNLTINEENRLKLEVKALKTEREKEISDLKNQMKTMRSDIEKELMNGMDQYFKNPNNKLQELVNEVARLKQVEKQHIADNKAIKELDEQVKGMRKKFDIQSKGLSKSLDTLIAEKGLTEQTISDDENKFVDKILKEVGENETKRTRIKVKR